MDPLFDIMYADAWSNWLRWRLFFDESFTTMKDSTLNLSESPRSPEAPEFSDSVAANLDWIFHTTSQSFTESVSQPGPTRRPKRHRPAPYEGAVIRKKSTPAQPSVSGTTGKVNETTRRGRSDANGSREEPTEGSAEGQSTGSDGYPNSSPNLSLIRGRGRRKTLKEGDNKYDFLDCTNRKPL